VTVRERPCLSVTADAEAFEGKVKPPLPPANPDGGSVVGGVPERERDVEGVVDWVCPPEPELVVGGVVAPGWPLEPDPG